MEAFIRDPQYIIFRVVSDDFKVFIFLSSRFPPCFGTAAAVTEGPLDYPDGPAAPRRRSLNAPPKENKSTPTDITCSYSKGLNN